MNLILSVLILIVFMVFVYFLFFKHSGNDLDKFEEEDIDRFSEEYLKNAVLDKLDQILQTDYSALNLNKYETMKNERNRAMLRSSLRECSRGNLKCKNYVKDTMRGMLQSEFGITEETYNNVIPFNDEAAMTAQDKFDVLLYVYFLKYKYNAFDEMVSRNGLDKPYGEGVNMHYEITAQDIYDLYSRSSDAIAKLDYYDYLKIITQRIYQISCGLGCICELRDMVIDGINCGTSGIPNTFYIPDADARFGAAKGELPRASYNAVWVMYKGKMLHCSFMGFGTQRELERVTKLIYRHDNPGTLDKATGRIVNYMFDGSRVTAARPDFAESWMFHVRKFDSASSMSFYELYPFKGNDKLLNVLSYIIRGSRNVVFTGEQAVGKSTVLASAVQFIPASLSIRVQEMAFELHLRKLYIGRNIGTYRETTTVSAQQGIEFMRKTDGTVGIFGEVAQSSVAAIAVELGEVGLKQVMMTQHAKTTQDLIEWFRDSVVKESGFNNEELVEKTVARVLNFDVHLAKALDGTRYIERVTEVVPHIAEPYSKDVVEAQKQYYYRQTDRAVFDSVDILVFDVASREYHFVNMLSDYTIAEIRKALTQDECVEFSKFVESIAKEVAA